MRFGGREYSDMKERGEVALRGLFHEEMSTILDHYYSGDPSKDREDREIVGVDILLRCMIVAEKFGETRMLKSFVRRLTRSIRSKSSGQTRKNILRRTNEVMEGCGFLVSEVVKNVVMKVILRGCKVDGKEIERFEKRFEEASEVEREKSQRQIIESLEEKNDEQRERIEKLEALVLKQKKIIEDMMKRMKK